ncbi:hypothetical protein ONZ45_g7851 [Pleurotus djamor]|nr:hypothetical protein ONZ45_g7851 [Pleurotus djamor]
MHLVRLFIERSKDAPLSIYSFDGRARGEEMVFLLQQSHRWKEVYFQDCEPEFLPMFNDLQLPILEVLVLGACWFSPMLANIRFAPEVAAGAIPPLRELRLTLCYSCLDIPFLSNLRSLSIVHRPGAVAQPMREVLCALKQMEHLESLELTRFLGFSDNIPQKFCVELPQLRLLRLCVEDPQVLKILKNIACPSMQTIVARSDTHLGRFATDILVAEVSAAFYSLIPGAPSSWLAKASLVMGAQYSANTMTMLPPSSTSPPSQLVLLGRGNSIGIMFSQLQLGSPLPLQTLDVVLTDSSHPVFDWGIFKTTMQSLDAHELHMHDVDDLTNLFIDTPVDSQPGVLLPSLNSIDVEFTTGRLRYSERNLGKLRKALSDRNSRQGGVLEVLRFRSHLDKPPLEIFKTVAKRVEFVHADGTTEELRV